MNKKLVIIILSIVLALLIALGGVWFLFFRKPANNTPPIDVERLTVAGDIIYAEDFAEVASGSVPSGWDKTYLYPFLRDADKSTSASTEGTGRNHISVSHSKDDVHTLNFYGRNGANILTLPSISEEDFVASFDMSFKDFKNSFGVAVGICEDYTATESVTLFTMSGIDLTPKDELDNTVPCFSVYEVCKKKGGPDFVTQEINRLDFKMADFVPNAVVTSNSETGEGTVPLDSILKITIYRFSGRFYFYCNDKLIYDIAEKSDKPSTRIGFFSDTEGGEVLVYNFSANKLEYIPDKIKDLLSAKPLVSQSFTEACSELPEDFKPLDTKWLENSANGVATIDGGKLKLSSKNCCTALALPLTEFSDTCVTVNLTLDSLDGEIGIIDNITSPLSSSKGGMFATFKPAENKFRHYTFINGTETNIKEYSLEQTGLESVPVGSNLSLKIYSFDSVSYFFVNDTYISYSPISFSNYAKHYSAIFTKGNSGISVSSVTVEAMAQIGVTNNLSIFSSELISENNTVGLSFEMQFKKSDIVYQETNPKDVSFGVAIASCEGKTPIRINNKTENIIRTEASDLAESSATITYKSVLKEIPKADLNKYICVSGYMAVKSGENTLYFFGTPTVLCPAIMASNIYLESSSATKDTFDTIFKGCSNYIGKYEKSVTFGLFSDFHYKANMYSTSVKDMEAIFERVKKAGASFVLSGGDMCNDFSGSPEITNAFLKNKHNITAYNIYGNHELETSGNTMQIVTPLLTNDPNVVWGTANGKIGKGDIGYYYADRDGFRIVCIDTNYSYNPSSAEWQHNTPGSFGAPTGNTKTNSLGPVQLEWLEKVLTDAAESGLGCIIIGHDSMAGKFRSTSPDATTVKEIYSKANAIRKGTVLISINGHIHSNNNAVIDDVLYLDMNTTRNCLWVATGSEHYSSEHTYEFIEYDDSGNPVSTTTKSLNELSMGKNTWFAADPLSAIVTVSQYGSITVEGATSKWIYDVVPSNTHKDEGPSVSSGKWELLK